MSTLFIVKNDRLTEGTLRYYFLLLFIFATIYAFTMNTPLSHDDWLYAFVYPTSNRIQSIGDVFVSQYNHYFLQNGRTVSHFLIQLFVGYIGKTVFNVVNALVFTLFIALVVEWAVKDSHKKFEIATIVFILLLSSLSQNSFKEFFLGITVSCAYLWSAVFVFVFMHLRRHYENVKTTGPVKAAMLICVGVLCGWTHEIFVVPVAFFIFCDIIFTVMVNKTKMPINQMMLSLGFLIGAGLIVLSPGSLQRAANTYTSNGLFFLLLDYVYALSRLISNISLFWICIALLLFSRFINKISLKRFVFDNKLLIVAIGVAGLFALLVKSVNIRTAFGVEFFSLLLLVKLLAGLDLPKVRWFYAANCVSLILICYILPAQADNYSRYEKFLEKIRISENNVIETDFKKYNFYLDKFVLSPLTHGSHGVFNGFDKNGPENKWISWYFDKSDLVFLPSELVHDMKQYPERFNEFDVKADYPVYLKIRNNSSKKIKHANYVLGTVDGKKIPLYFKPISKFMARYTEKQVPIDSVYEIELFGVPYYAIKENNYSNKILKERLVGISYE